MFSKLKSHLVIVISLFSIIWTFNNPAYSSADPGAAIKRQDPAFFRFITAEGKEIYILGSPHFVPLRDLLAPQTLSEIERLADENAVLYTEHEVTNEVELAYLARPENCFPEDSLSVEINFFTALAMSSEAAELESSPENLLLGLGERRSDVPLLDIARAQMWLGTVMLGTHAGILSYDHVGGTEHELLYGPLKDKWKSKLHLETVEEAIGYLKQCARNSVDDRSNKSWVRDSVEKILMFRRDPGTAVTEIRKENNRNIEKYSWRLFIDGGPDVLPLSCIKRNELWTNVMAKKLREPSADMTPIFIVVGTGHLAGFSSGCSFIRLLMEELGVTELQRFKNDDGWITTITLSLQKVFVLFI